MMFGIYWNLEWNLLVHFFKNLYVKIMIYSEIYFKL